VAIDFCVLLVTDRRRAPGEDLERVVEQALEGGIRAVQLREKDLGGRELLELARALRALTARAGARLFVNDRIDVALAAGADGVHLGRASIPPGEARRLLPAGALVGCSVHGLEELRDAEEGGADFVTFGPVYVTPSKAAWGPPAGTQALARACRAARVPVFAIGGVTAESAPEVMAAGAAGVAVISAVVAARDPRAAAAELVERVAAAAREGR